MRTIVGVFDTGEDPSLSQAEVPDHSWLDSIHRRDLPDICSVCGTKLKMFET